MRRCAISIARLPCEAEFPKYVVVATAAWCRLIALRLLARFQINNNRLGLSQYTLVHKRHKISHHNNSYVRVLVYVYSLSLSALASFSIPLRSITALASYLYLDIQLFSPIIVAIACFRRTSNNSPTPLPLCWHSIFSLHQINCTCVRFALQVYTIRLSLNSAN